MTDEARRASGSNVRSLTDALRKARIAEADRTDVMVDMQEAERARLDLLAEELNDVFAEIPANDDQFILAVAPGTPPRLWIDATAFVTVGRDRRTYRFLKDTRLGRTVIAESATIAAVADTITNYIAERIIERERTIEGDWLIRRVRESAPAAPPPGRALAPQPLRPARERRPLIEPRYLGWVVAGFLFGILIGAIGLFVYAWTQVPG